MGLTWAFGFAFLKRTSISLTDTVVWNTSFLDCTDTSLLWSLMVAPGPGAEGQLSHMMEHSQVGCPAIHRLSWPWLCVFMMNRGWRNILHLWSLRCCAQRYGALFVQSLLSRRWKNHTDVVASHAIGTNAREQLWFKSCGTFFRVVFFHSLPQAGNTKFNRAKLLNVGYLEALKEASWDCFIFHDVDLVPENDFNIYMCDTQPKHLVVGRNNTGYR